MSDFFRTHGLQHARFPSPSATPRVYSNSCPLSWWCHPTISSSVVPFTSHLQSFPASGSFPRSQLFTSGGQSIQFHHCMANRWRNNGNSDCSHEIKTYAPWKEAMTNLDSVLKNRDITLPTEVQLVKAMVFPVIMYGCESQTIKKVELYSHPSWCWRKAFKL